MKQLKVKTRIINKDLKTPPLQYAKQGDAGIDLTATSLWYDEYGNTCFGTNRAFEIPEGYVGLLFPRSSNSKKDLLLSNSVGLIDSGYRGEVILKFKPSVIFCDNMESEVIGEVSKEFDFIGTPNSEYPFQQYSIGDRVGQLIIIPYPQIEFEEVEELSSTERSNGAFGSSGN